jgi:RNA 2'-O ribose methyltransferase substrate binding
MDRLTGIHAVREALESGRALERIVVARGRHGERIEELVASAREHNVPVRFEERGVVDRLAGTTQHQGVLAMAGAKQALGLEDLIRTGASISPEARLLVILDGVEDPHNLGTDYSGTPRRGNERNRCSCRRRSAGTFAGGASGEHRARNRGFKNGRLLDCGPGRGGKTKTFRRGFHRRNRRGVGRRRFWPP